MNFNFTDRIGLTQTRIQAYVSKEALGYETPARIQDIAIGYDYSPAGPDQAGMGNGSAILDRRQVIDFHLDRGKPIPRFGYTGNCESDRRVNKAGYGAAVHYSLQLQEIVADFEAEHGAAVLNRVQFDPEQSRIVV
jgi:hypothetical protein